MTTTSKELLDAFQRLGRATDSWVDANRAATEAASRLTAATREVNAARDDMVRLVKAADVHAPGNYGFDRRLADLLAFLASRSASFDQVTEALKTEGGAT